MDESLKSRRSVDPPSPTDDEIVRALVEIDQASKDVPAASAAPAKVTSNTTLAVLFAVVFGLIVLLLWAMQRPARKILSSLAWRMGQSGGPTIKSTTDGALQAEAEILLGRVAAGDAAATNQVLASSDNWTGKTQTTPKTDQLIGTIINKKDLQARAAGLQAQLALNGVSRDAQGFNALEHAADDPSRRSWALWLLGALGNRGVDPVHTAKVIESYMNDPDVQVRSNAVIGLALLGTDETIPMELERFRNDPSPTVQELAICGLSEAGMYTHPQRMVAAATLVGWLDDAPLTAHQRTWTLQALHDISGQNLGSDSKPWRQWLDASR